MNPNSITKDDDRGIFIAGVTQIDEGSPNSMFLVHPYGEDVVKVRPFVLSVLPEPCHYDIRVNTILQHHLCSC